MGRYFIHLAYNSANFNGQKTQLGLPTVQQRWSQHCRPCYGRTVSRSVFVGTVTVNRISI